MRLPARSIALLLAFATGSVSAQDKGTIDPKPLPPLANPNAPHLGAKELFARKTLPASLAASRPTIHNARACGWWFMS